MHRCDRSIALIKGVGCIILHPALSIQQPGICMQASRASYCYNDVSL